jgi:hypothetical protein
MAGTPRTRVIVVLAAVVALGAIVAINLGNRASTTDANRDRFERGQGAYLAGDCAAALAAFDEITDDKAGYAAEAQPWRDECTAVAAARSKEITAPDAALVAYSAFALEHPQSPLLESIVTRIAAIVSTRGAAGLATTSSCAALADIERAGLAATAKLDAGAFILECAKVAAAAKNLDEQARLQLLFLTRFGTRPEAASVEKTLLANVGTCRHIDALPTEPALVARGGFVASATLMCANFAEFIGHPSDAVKLFQRFLTSYPGDARAGDARAGLARSLIAQAKAGNAGTLPEPSVSGSAASGTVRVTIENASPDHLRLVLNGAETRIESVDACGQCKVYSVVGPLSCPSGLPSLTLQLTPGVYDVLVESTDGSSVTPFVGSWDLRNATAYRSCFYIVRRV